MNPIDDAMLAHYMTVYPGVALTARPFLGGTQSRIGVVPLEWNGQSIDLGDPWQR